MTEGLESEDWTTTLAVACPWCKTEIEDPALCADGCGRPADRERPMSDRCPTTIERDCLD